MLAALQKQAEAYFAQLPPAQCLTSEPTLNQLRQFYLMLAALHVGGSQLALQHLAQQPLSDSAHHKPMVEALWGVSLQVRADSQQGRRMTSLVGQLHARNLIDKGLLLEGLPDWLSKEAGLIEGASFERRLVRVNTKINYEQNKHCLIRDSNEGYAKLALLLTSLTDHHPVAPVWQRIVQMVGYFDLDPDRVLELIIEPRRAPQLTLQLLTHFSPASLVALLGNKLRMWQGRPIEEKTFAKLVYCGHPETGSLSELSRQVTQLPSASLVALTSQLIKQRIISFSSLLPYLEPSDAVIKGISKRVSEQTLRKVTQCFTLRTDELTADQKAAIDEEENQLFEGQLVHSTKLALLAGMVEANAWDDFTLAWKQYRGKVDLLLYQPLLTALLDRIEWAIEPLSQPLGFHRYFPTEPTPDCAQRQPATKDNQLAQFRSLEPPALDALVDLLGLVGSYVGWRPRLFIKLCRVARQLGAASERLVATVLVPALSMGHKNAPMAMELHQTLECFDYGLRFGCYLESYKGGMADNPHAARTFERVMGRQNRIVNNLSKENKKLFIRKVAKLTHNQGLPVLYWIWRRMVMGDYEAIVPEIVAVLNNCSPLTQDMAVFTLLYLLKEHHESPLHPKTYETQSWFKNITTFASHFFRKYLEADLSPLFDFILQQTALPLSDLDEDGLMPPALLRLLHELLNKMHGTVTFQSLNKSKHDALACGPRLQAEILEISSEVKAAKKSRLVLQKFFWGSAQEQGREGASVFRLLCLLCQKRSEVITKAFVDDLRTLGDIFDDYTLLVVQVVRVLESSSQGPAHYAQLLPASPLPLLLSHYKLPLELACHILRPATKHISSMGPEEWHSLTSTFAECFKAALLDPEYLSGSLRLPAHWNLSLSHYKARVLEVLPPSLFTAFWFLTLDSLYFPAKHYQERIDQIKKKLQPGRRNQRETDKLKSLLEKLTSEEQVQSIKCKQTLSEGNLARLESDILRGTREGAENLMSFADIWVQVCLLPRMMLDRSEALYCARLTFEVIKANRMSSTKSIKLLTYVIEYVMVYLPYTTHREANSCLSVFLAEILTIFNQWDSPPLLKQQLHRALGVEDPPGKDHYPKLKDYLVKLFERVGNILCSITQEPYIIKNCLYLLEKIDTIPAYQQQADQLVEHIEKLKETYTAVDMRTIFQRQSSIIVGKKQNLPTKPEPIEAKKPNNPAVKAHPQPPQDKQHQPRSKSPAPRNEPAQPTPQPRRTDHPQSEKKDSEKPKFRFTDKPTDSHEASKEQGAKGRPEQSKMGGGSKSGEEEKRGQVVGPPKTLKELKEMRKAGQVEGGAGQGEERRQPDGNAHTKPSQVEPKKQTAEVSLTSSKPISQANEQETKLKLTRLMEVLAQQRKHERNKDSSSRPDKTKEPTHKPQEIPLPAKPHPQDPPLPNKDSIKDHRSPPPPESHNSTKEENTRVRNEAPRQKEETGRHEEQPKNKEGASKAREENNPAKEGQKRPQDSWDHKSREHRDSNYHRDSRDARDIRDGRDSRDVRDNRDNRDNRDSRGETRDNRDSREVRDSRGKDSQGPRDGGSKRDGREERESRGKGFVFNREERREDRKEKQRKFERGGSYRRSRSREKYGRK